MSEVIETDFVLGKIDGQRYEPVAIELRNRLRCNGRLKDCLDTILETFDDTNSAMLFSAVASLIDKMFNGLEYELENLFWEPTVFADRSTGRFVSLVFMLGDCRISEVARVIFDVELDIGGRDDLFNKRFADKLCETNKGLFIDRQIVEESEKLLSLRKTYIEGDKATKERLSGSILTLEKQLENMINEPLVLEKKARNAEVNFLRNKR